MNIIIFASNSRATNIGLKSLIQKRKDEIKAIVKVDQLKGNIFSKLKSFFRYSGKTSWLFIIYKLYDGFTWGGIKKIADANGIDFIEASDVNDSKFIDKLTVLKPDLSISFFTQQIFKKPIISLPKYGTINIHGSLLPHYKGAAQYFWYLSNGDKIGGVTVHFVDEKIDTGDLVLQESFKIIGNETMRSIHIKLGVEGAALLDKAVELIKNGKIKSTKQPNVKEIYLKLPTSAEMIAFRKKGYKIY